MKILIIFAVFVGLSVQDRITTTQELQEAQAELTLEHETGETTLINNRQNLSEALVVMEEHVLDSFMTAYSQIKIHSITVREEMADLGDGDCQNSVRARWELQVTRFGQKLSQCLGVAHGYLVSFTNRLNQLHHSSRTYSNAIPNTSIRVLMSFNFFDESQDIRDSVREDLGELIWRISEYEQEFREYIDEIADSIEDYVLQLTACFRSLPRTFENESRWDLEAIRSCNP